MNFEKYIGIPYSFDNSSGVNCWTLVALIYADLFDSELGLYPLATGTAREISSVFTQAFAKGDHGFKEVKFPKNYDIVIFNRKEHYHCGIYFDGFILHCSQYTGGVSYQPFLTVKKGFNEVSYWQK